jgi:hypothetical protein
MLIRDDEVVAEQWEEKAWQNRGSHWIRRQRNAVQQHQHQTGMQSRLSFSRLF